MSTLVPESPPLATLSALRVSAATSQRHGRAIQDAGSFLIGQALPVVISQSCPLSSGSDTYFAYKRSCGARGLRVGVELMEAGVASTCNVQIQLVSAIPAFLGDGGDLRGPTDFLSAVPYPLSSPRQWVDYVNVKAIPVGQLEWFRVRWTDGPVTGTQGIAKLHVFEVPRSSLADDALDAGVDGAWPWSGNPLWDGSPSDTDGFRRLAAEIDRARSQVRQHRQCSTVESDETAWLCGQSTEWAPVLFGRSAQPYQYLRARRLYEPTTPNSLTFTCRYKTGSFWEGAALRIRAESIGTGTVIENDIDLPASLDWTSLPEVAVSVPCDGAQQQVRLSYEYAVKAGAVLRMSNRALIENES